MFKNYFELENYREQCALSNSDKAFLATYNDTGLPIIKNENTRKEWESQLGDIPHVADPMTDDRINTTVSLIKQHPQIHSILDIGIGNAWVEKKLFAAHEGPYSLTGIDITPLNLKKLEQSLPGTYYVGDVLSLPKPLLSSTFSCVLLLEVLEHISPKDTFSALKTIRKLLSKDGHFILSVPIYEDLEEKIKNKQNVSKHVRRYTPPIIKKELELAGFKLQSTSTFYAFSTMYTVKSMCARLTGIRKPNVILIDAVPT